MGDEVAAADRVASSWSGIWTPSTRRR